MKSLLIGMVSVSLALGLVWLLGKSFFEERLRKTIEEEMNARLEGYSVQLREIDLQLRGLAVSMRDVVLTQDAHPEPAVARISSIRASVEWRQVFRGRLVADVLFQEPVLYFDLKQLREEVQATVPVEERGWQEALEAAYFLQFNSIEVRDGDVTYIDQDPDRPLHVRDLQFRVEDIRAGDEDNAYPSTFELKAFVFGDGYVAVQGGADFLKNPSPAVAIVFQLDRVSIEQVQPVLEHVGVLVNGGLVDCVGELEFGAGTDWVHIREFALRELHLDYVVTEPVGDNTSLLAEEEPKEGVEGEAMQAVVEGPNPRELELKIDKATISGVFGVINDAPEPSYRVFVSDAHLTLSDYSNHFLEGPATARLEGLFMGSGSLVAQATFRPEKEGPDFDLSLEIQDTELSAMNDLLQAHANFDVESGTFSFFSELTIQGGQIEGYLRPLFGDVEVSSLGEEDKGVFKKFYERLVAAVISLLENVPRDEVATQADISGSLRDPDLSTWQIIVGLIRNAFFEAILPGFESEVDS